MYWALFPLFKVNEDGISTPSKKHIGDANNIAKIYKKLCQKVNIEEYHPHCFRHYAIFKALNYVRTGIQMRALSQNVGHEEISTILEQYAKMKPEIYAKVIGLMIKEETNKDLSKFTSSELIEELSKREKQRLIFQ